MGCARTKPTAITCAVALALMAGSAHAASLVGSTVSSGFYVSGDFVVDAMGTTIDPNGDSSVLYSIDRFYGNVLITNGASFTFSDPVVG